MVKGYIVFRRGKKKLFRTAQVTSSQQNQDSSGILANY